LLELLDPLPKTLRFQDALWGEMEGGREGGRVDEFRDMKEGGQEGGRKGGREGTYQDELLVFLRGLVAGKDTELGDELSFVLGLAFLLVLGGGGREGRREGRRVEV